MERIKGLRKDKKKATAFGGLHTWNKLSSSLPRYGASGVVFSGIVDNNNNNNSSSSRIMYLIGGSDEKGNFSKDMLRFDLRTASWLPNITDETFPVRHFHSTVSFNNKLWIFGGKSNGYINDIWSYDIATSKWAKVECTGKVPSPRYGHTGAVYHQSLWVFGGYDNLSSTCNDLYEFNFETREWKKVEPVSKERPPSRFHHTAVVAYGKMIVYGGIGDDGKSKDDMWEFDFEKLGWTKTEYKSKLIPAGRHGHTSFAYGSGIVVFGGLNKKDNKCFDDLYKFDLELKQWALIQSEGAPPSGRFHHAAIHDEGIVYVYGGKNTSDETFSDLYQQILNIDYFSLLPDEICRKIFSYLPSAADLGRLAVLNKRMNKLTNDDNLWMPTLKNWNIDIERSKFPDMTIREFLYENIFSSMIPQLTSGITVWRNPHVWGKAKADEVNRKLYKK